MVVGPYQEYGYSALIWISLQCNKAKPRRFVYPKVAVATSTRSRPLSLAR